MTHWLGGIRRKLSISFSLLVSAFAVFMVVFYPSRLERQARGSLIARAEAVRDMTAYSLSAGLYFGDTIAIREVLDGAARDTEVTLLEARDLTGRLTAIQRDARGAATHDAIVGDGYVTPDGSTYITAAPVLHGTTQVGTLFLGLSLAELRSEVRAARQLGLIVGALILVIGLALVYTVSTLVTRPLLDLVGTVRRIAAGDLSLRAPATSDADVSQLVNAVNSMVDSLAGAQAELARINAELEARVQARTAELESLIDLAPAAIIAVDLDWHITRWNRGATKIFGWTADEVIGGPIPYVTQAEHIAELRLHQASLRNRGMLPAVDVTRRRKDGSPVNILVSAATLLDARGHPTGYLAFVADLTERKSLEEQLRQAQKMEAVGRLAGGIAHDFNNILTVISGCAALLRESTVTAEQREDVEQIAVAAERASALTNQLLTFSRQEVVQLESVNLNEVVHGMGPMLRRLLRENIRVTTTLGGEVGSVTADRRQLEQVLLNLVVNASDAMPQGGALAIETQRVHLDEAFSQRHRGVSPGSFVMLTVRDTGVGMDAKTIQNIFDPFFTTKDVGKGTGLGLATVYTVATQLDGCVEVKSSKGNGATFNVYLPQAEPQPAAQAPTSEAPAPTSKGRETVLLVEDEEPVRRVLRRTLERLGYAVLDAPSGETALAVANKHDGAIDIVVTDLMMPGMNGREFADRLHATKPELRVVFMSGYIEERVRQGGLVDANHAFLQKPFTGPELGEAIRSLLDGRPRVPPPS